MSETEEDSEAETPKEYKHKSESVLKPEWDKKFDITKATLNDDVDIGEQVVLIAYNALMASAEIFNIYYERLKKVTRGEGGSVISQFAVSIDKLNQIVDMALKVQENLRKLNTREEIIKELDTLRNDISLLKNVNPTKYNELMADIDKTQRKAEALAQTN